MGKMAKKGIDFVVAIIALILCTPIIIVAGIAILVADGRPIFFVQRRPGLNGRIFRLFKFRTMRNPSAATETDKERTFALGAFLRKYSIDELPQLFNVIQGDLSLVGPRPLLEEYLPLYNEKQAKRHLVRPGITGWAQVNGRNTITWEQKFEYDVWYVENWSLWLDLKILLLTVKKVLRGADVDSSQAMTMEKFKGS